MEISESISQIFLSCNQLSTVQIYLAIASLLLYFIQRKISKERSIHEFKEEVIKASSFKDLDTTSTIFDIFIDKYYDKILRYRKFMNWFYNIFKVCYFSILIISLMTSLGYFLFKIYTTFISGLFVVNITIIIVTLVYRFYFDKKTMNKEYIETALVNFYKERSSRDNYLKDFG